VARTTGGLWCGGAARARRRVRRYPGQVLSRFVTPRWLGLHALTLVSLVVLGRIGWWQLDKARGAGDWQNYGYAVQWWLFGAFALFLWGKLVLDELDPSRVEARRETVDDLDEVVQPQAPAPADDEDDELAAYNRHLAELAQRSRR